MAVSVSFRAGQTAARSLTRVRETRLGPALEVLFRPSWLPAAGGNAPRSSLLHRGLEKAARSSADWRAPRRGADEGRLPEALSPADQRRAARDFTLKAMCGRTRGISIFPPRKTEKGPETVSERGRDVPPPGSV